MQPPKKKHLCVSSISKGAIGRENINHVNLDEELLEDDGSYSPSCEFEPESETKQETKQKALPEHMYCISLVRNGRCSQRKKLGVDYCRRHLSLLGLGQSGRK